MNSQFKKVLIIRTGAIGDVVHTTNLVHSIKQAYPEVIIHYMTNPMVEFLLSSDKSIDKVITINPKFKLFSSYTKEMSSVLNRKIMIW